MCCGEGLCSRPPYTGHRPLRILNSELFPQPFGPVINRCIPSSTCKSENLLIHAQRNNRASLRYKSPREKRGRKQTRSEIHRSFFGVSCGFPVCPVLVLTAGGHNCSLKLNEQQHWLCSVCRASDAKQIRNENNRLVAVWLRRPERLCLACLVYTESHAVKEDVITGSKTCSDVALLHQGLLVFLWNALILQPNRMWRASSSTEEWATINTRQKKLLDKLFSDLMFHILCCTLIHSSCPN